MLKLRKTIKHVSKRILCLTYSTFAAEEPTKASEDDITGFGFTAEDLLNAKHYDDIPSPRFYPIVGNLFQFKPFGELNVFDRIAVGTKLHERHGDIVRFTFPFFPAINHVTILNPDDFEIVYRNEGRYPSRPTNPVMLKYRRERNHSLGLFLANGEEWWKFRQPLNPGMMKVNAAKPYLSVQDAIGDDFIRNIKTTLQQRDDNIHSMIMDNIFRYSLESVCAIVFDKRLGCMDVDLKPDSWQQEFIHSVHTAFQAVLPVSVNPMYRIFNAVGYKAKQQVAFEKSMDYITDTSLKLMEESRDKWTSIPDAELQKKFLAQLLNIENVAIEDKVSVIFDMMLAAIDTTTYTTIHNCFYLAKNPAVQEKLFKELEAHVEKGVGEVVFFTCLYKRIEPHETDSSNNKTTADAGYCY